jgi:nicotinate-nucleotide pyrophosphorylase (carboxylating)
VTINPPRINDFRQRISWRDVESSQDLKDLIKICIREDLNPQKVRPTWEYDLTSEVCNLLGTGTAQLTCREPLIVCGIQLAHLLIEAFSCDQLEFQSHLDDGVHCEKDQTIGTISGSIKQILAIERTLLNFIQRLSGVATSSARFVSILDPYGVGLLDTRKTTPGHRLLEKYATSCGGSFNHRLGLFDRILIKDNHLAAAGVDRGDPLMNFLREVKERDKEKLVEVEIDHLSQLPPAMESGVDAVLLDNFTPSDVAKAVEMGNDQLVLEASGGINQKNILEYAQARPHFISSGAPIHNAKWIDIGLDWID